MCKRQIYSSRVASTVAFSSCPLYTFKPLQQIQSAPHKQPECGQSRFHPQFILSLDKIWCSHSTYSTTSISLFLTQSCCFKMLQCTESVLQNAPVHRFMVSFTYFIKALKLECCWALSSQRNLQQSDLQLSWLDF